MAEVWGSGGVVTPAATVVPIRDGVRGLEVLLLRRNARGMFGGMWVFPGGKVDEVDRIAAGPADETLEGPGADTREGEILAARRAAVREAAEEADLLLDESQLVVLSFWIPPPEAPRRFATWFFLAPADAGIEITVDDGEIHEHRWMTPPEAMGRRDAGEIELAPPTFMTLWWLAEHLTADSALDAARGSAPQHFATHIGMAGKVMVSMWEGDAAYGGGDALAPGPRRRLVMDPAGWRVELSERSD